MKKLKINQDIRAFKVQLIDENGKQLGVMEKEKALAIANDRNFDLVEVSPNTNPSVCKLLNYGRYKYQQIKKEQKQRLKTKQKEMKNIRLSARIDKHDLAVKLRQVEKFLTKGHKVKIILMLKGREMAHSERGFEVIDNFVQQLISHYQNKEGPNRERNTIQIILDPSK